MKQAAQHTTICTHFTVQSTITAHEFTAFLHSKQRPRRNRHVPAQIRLFCTMLTLPIKCCDLVPEERDALNRPFKHEWKIAEPCSRKHLPGGQQLLHTFRDRNKVTKPCYPAEHKAVPKAATYITITSHQKMKKKKRGGGGSLFSFCVQQRLHIPFFFFTCVVCLF